MLIVLGCIFIAMVICGAMMVYRSCDCDDVIGVGGIFMIITGVIATVIVVIASLFQINALVNLTTIDEKIAMYDEQNVKIEEQIEIAVKQYQEYESGIITEIVDKSSYISLVSLYPELKADTLVNKQIEVYLNNNQTIADLKNQKLDEKVYRWWLYFGS